MSQPWDELLKRDHEVTERVFAAMEAGFGCADGPPPEQVGLLADYLHGYVEECHNQKEELHLFPRLEAAGMPRHAGPLGVMLQEHERATALLGRLVPLASAYAAGELGRLATLRAVFAEYAALCKDHFWKENDILYPMALRLLNEAQAAEVVRGIEAVEASLGADTRQRYYQIAERIIALGDLRDLSFGLDRDVLAAILNTLPVELSFIDREDRVRYFSHEHGEKIFGRTRGAIGMAVQNCHPPKSVHLVEQILSDFKTGRREVAEFWIDMNGRTVHIRYWPVRGSDGRYMGTLETVQDVSAIRNLTGEQRLLDAVQ
jgi:PAS domain S-box-containing protein